MERKVLEAFKLPCKYSSGYIFDSNDQMMMEVRGWGHLQYLPDAGLLQDTLGEMMAAAFNEKYAVDPNARVDGKKEEWEYILQSSIYTSLIGYSDSNGHSIPCKTRGQMETSILKKFKKRLEEGKLTINSR